MSINVYDKRIDKQWQINNDPVSHYVTNDDLEVQVKSPLPVTEPRFQSPSSYSTHYTDYAIPAPMAMKCCIFRRKYRYCQQTSSCALKLL
jgi:hypothetical protein